MTRIKHSIKHPEIPKGKSEKKIGGENKFGSKKFLKTKVAQNCWSYPLKSYWGRVYGQTDRPTDGWTDVHHRVTPQVMPGRGM